MHNQNPKSQMCVWNKNETLRNSEIIFESLRHIGVYETLSGGKCVRVKIWVWAWKRNQDEKYMWKGEDEMRKVWVSIQGKIYERKQEDIQENEKVGRNGWRMGTLRNYLWEIT